MNLQYPTWTEREYHANKNFVGSSMLSVFEQSPKLYHAQHVVQTHSPETTSEQRIGTAVHLGFLEPSRFDQEVKVIPKCDRRTKAGKEAYESFLLECGPSSLILEFEESRRVAGMLEALLSNPLVAEWFSQVTDREKAITWQCDRSGLGLKVKFDALTKTGFGDLKTSAAPMPLGFEKSVARYYLKQLCQYAEGFREMFFGVDPTVHYIVVGNKFPHDCYVYEVDMQIVDECHQDWQFTVERLAECYRTGVWMAPEQKVVTKLKLPSWGLGNKYVETF